MNLQGIKKRIAKILVYSTTGIIFLLIYSFLILQFQAVQEALANQFLKNFSQVTGFNSSVKSIRFSWYDRLELRGVLIEDAAKNEMIAVQRLVINYKLSLLFGDKDINLDAVEVDSARVFFTKIPVTDTTRSLNINVFINAINKQYGGSGGTGKGPKINIGEALVVGSRFALDNTGTDSLSGFDYRHFAVNIPQAELQSFFVLGDTVEFKVEALSAIDEKTNFGINNLTTLFRISQQGLEFEGINLSAGRSFITDTIRFHYNSQADLNSFNDNVKIYANLTKSVIHPEDLGLFAPGIKKLSQPLTVTGQFKGRVNNFRSNNFIIETGNTLLQGAVSMDGLPDFNETFIVLNLKNSRISPLDLKFLFNETTSKRIEPLGTLSLSAEFLGYPTDFVAKGNFSNRLGRIISDINLKINEANVEQSSYRGQLSLIDFNLGEYLADTTTFQKATLNGSIEGRGFTGNTANFKLVSSIKSLGIKKYNYQNISTDASFASKFFNGAVTIDDPNVKLQALGSIDLRNNANIIKVKTEIDTLNFNTINLLREQLSLQGNIDLNMKGLDIDSISGKAIVENMTIRLNDEKLNLSNIVVEADHTSQERSLHLNSDLIDADLTGNFYLSSIFKDMQILFTELMLNAKNDKQAIEDYYTAKTTNGRVIQPYQTNFAISLKNIEPITNLLNLNLAVAKNLTIDGNFTQGETTIIKAFSKIDSLHYENFFLTNTEVEINASKLHYTPEGLVMAYMTSANQQLGTLRTKNLITEAIWSKEHIDFYVNVSQEKNNNYLQLDGIIDLQDSMIISLLPASKIQILEKIWSIDSNNRITAKGKEWNFEAFDWKNDQQSIGLKGSISTIPEKELTLTVKEFNLTTINSITLQELSGMVNAKISAANLYGNPSVQDEISILDLKVNNFLVGNITGNNVWDNVEKEFVIEFFIDRLNQRIINCEGKYNPANKVSPLFITAKLVKANLKIIEPFIAQIFSNINGTISGTYYVTGSLSKPELNGTGQLENAQLMVNYLKTTYDITGTIGLRPDAISFQNIELQDVLKNKGSLSGEITHNNFKQMAISMNARFENFQLLNLSARDNDLFYGQGYATGDVRFDGPLNNLKITANARTNKNTRISIPIAGTTTAEKKDYLNFVNFTDTTYQTTVTTTSTKRVTLTGVTFDFNLDVTPDAYCEIIFDIKAGDIIHGRGNGRIKLQLNTQGEFNMFGPVVFTEGGYNFTLYDIINKEFDIQAGSSIAWYGDPYQGTMQINATYNQLASFAPILLDQTLSSVPQIRRKYPVQVLLKLNGPMLSPDIDFDILAKDLPKSIPVEGGKPDVRLDFEFQAFKNKLDEVELKRQVFSLIVLRKFSPPESFNTSGSIVSSVSELFSNQLSYWMSQVDENLEIDVDLGTMDQESFNAFQLRLSYTFLNGRLRITRDGTFGNQGTTPTTTNPTTPQTNRTDYASAVGDWTVDYLLTPDGKFKVKMYSRTNVNPINNNINSQNAITTGVSLTYTQSFNELKDLLRGSREKNRRRPEDDLDTESDDENGNEKKNQ